MLSFGLPSQVSNFTHPHARHRHKALGRALRSTMSPRERRDVTERAPAMPVQVGRIGRQDTRNGTARAKSQDHTASVIPQELQPQNRGKRIVTLTTRATHLSANRVAHVRGTNEAGSIDHLTRRIRRGGSHFQRMARRAATCGCALARASGSIETFVR